MELEVPETAIWSWLEGSEDDNPHNQFNLMVAADVTDRVDVAATGHYVDSIENLDIEKYIAIDARLAWRPSSNLEVAAVGRNLFRDRHLEYLSDFNIWPTETETTGHLTLTWRF